MTTLFLFLPPVLPDKKWEQRWSLTPPWAQRVVAAMLGWMLSALVNLLLTVLLMDPLPLALKLVIRGWAVRTMASLPRNFTDIPCPLLQPLPICRDVDPLAPRRSLAP